MPYFRERSLVFWSFPFVIFLSGCGAKPKCDSFEGDAHRRPRWVSWRSRVLADGLCGRCAAQDLQYQNRRSKINEAHQEKRNSQPGS
jgi:hypothetical protein